MKAVRKRNHLGLSRRHHGCPTNAPWGNRARLSDLNTGGMTACTGSFDFPHTTAITLRPRGQVRQATRRIPHAHLDGLYLVSGLDEQHGDSIAEKARIQLNGFQRSRS